MCDHHVGLVGGIFARRHSFRVRATPPRPGNDRAHSDIESCAHWQDSTPGAALAGPVDPRGYARQSAICGAAICWISLGLLQGGRPHLRRMYGK